MKHLRISLGILALVLTLASCKPDVEACFTVTTNEGLATFNSDCSVSANTYLWDFGDGGTSTEKNPQHTYATSGTYTVTLRATSKRSVTNTVSEAVVITIPVDPCAGVACGVHGHCENGQCVCDPGYEGVDCGTALNAKFDGAYALTESCTSGNAGPYAVYLTPLSNPQEADFVALWEVPGSHITALIGADGLSFTIARQQITQGYDIECNFGFIHSDGSTVNLTYKVYQQSPDSLVDECTATLTK